MTNRIIVAIIIAAASSTAFSKVYERCELAKELKDMPEVPPDHVPIWTCIAFYESRFNTSAIGRLNGDWSWDHGLFQLSDRYWCGRKGRGGECRMACDELRDEDIRNDMECMRIIFEEHARLSGDGFNAWAVYGRCKGARAERFVTGCFDGDEFEANDV